MGTVKAQAALAVMALYCLFGGVSGAAEPRAAVRAIDIAPAAEGARLDVEVSSSLKPQIFFIEGAQPRFVLDFPAVAWPNGRAAGAGPGAGLAQGYRFAQRDAYQSRLVVDLRADARVVETARTRTPDGWRYSYTLSPIGAPAPRQAAPIEVPPRALVAVEYRDARKVVVIDAGHGGKDSGALGVSGRQEKDISLAAARSLKKQLEARGNYKVVLTRDSDTYVDLEDRVKIARAAKADLFISLHADANHNKAAKGASIYTLSSKGEARARSMTASQNWEIDFGETPRSQRAENILVELTQRESKSKSAEFADLVATHLEPVAPLIANTRRSENFFVLLAPDVPAVLLELGFMTHAEDEARLASPQARESMMKAVAAAIDTHFRPVMDRSYAEAGAERGSVLARLRP